MDNSLPPTRKPRPLRLPSEQVAAELADVGSDGMAWDRSGDQILEEEALSTRTTCLVDGKPIIMLAFRMTGVCCEYCRKVYKGEIVDERPAENDRTEV